jgi:PncC family amidohydrolase
MAPKGLARRILDGLVAQRATLAVAESCTGGMIGAALTSIPGSSVVFLGGVVAYSNEVKRRVLGVPVRVLARYGAVSAEAVRAMARGVRRLTGATYGVSVSGVAGPGGGTPGKPVGLVHIAVAGPRGVRARAYHFAGGRARVRAQAAAAALRLLAAKAVSRRR